MIYLSAEWIFKTRYEVPDWIYVVQVRNQFQAFVKRQDVRLWTRFTWVR
jgi:hypothetical protein